MVETGSIPVMLIAGCNNWMGSKRASSIKLMMRGGREIDINHTLITTDLPLIITNSKGKPMGYSGNLAEEAMDEGLPKREQRHANSTNHILGTDGIFTIKEIVFGGVVISFGMTWGGACLFFGWQCGRLVYYAVRSLITLIT